MRKSAFSDLYDRKYLILCLIQFGLLIAAMRVTSGAAFVAVVPLIFFGLVTKKTEMLFFWLLAAVCLVIGNVHIVTKGPVFAWTQRGLMLGLGGCMAVQVVGYPSHRVLKPFMGMMVYLVFMCFSSLQGWCPIISFLKLLLFTLIYFSYYGVANQIGVNPRVSTKKIRSVMLTFAIFFIFGSMALVPFPGLSQLRADEVLSGGGTVADLRGMLSLFTGMANHSQCLGPVVSTTAVILFGDLLFSIKKLDPLYVGMLLCCPYLIYLTSSRTGMGAFLVGMSFVAFLFMRSRGVGRRWKSKMMNVLMTLLVVLLAVLACSSSFQRGIRKFATKFGDDGGTITTEQVIMTRQGKIDEALDGFAKSPLIGNGFQVGESMKNLKLGGGVSILSAPIEKGVWVTAILEEGGVVGWVIFVTFLMSCVIMSIRRKAYIGAAALFLFTMTNLGEFTFFSMSYAGGYAWAMVFTGLALDIRKMKDENEALRRQMMEQERMAMMMGGQG